jgi:methyltransferase (TIGR00027 family)
MLNRNEGVEITSAYALVWKTFANQPTNFKDVFVKPGERDSVIFKEKTMPLFITPEVDAGAKARLPNLKMWGTTATRARFFRKALSRAVKKEGIKQVICLGAGLDTTAVEKNKPSYAGVKFFEADKQSVLAYKARVYLNNNIDKNAEYITLDYIKDDFIQALKDNGVDFASPTMILWEGNIFYLNNAEVKNTLSKLSAAFDHLSIALDFMHGEDEVEKSREMVAALTGFEKAKSPFRSFFNPDELKQFCGSLGLETVQCNTGAAINREYGVETEPYPTTEPYSMAVFKRA